MSNFQIGNFVVYPAQGVAEIEGVENRRLGGHSFPCLKVRLLDTEYNIWIPLNGVQQCGLRHVASRRVASRALQVFRRPPPTYKGISWIQRSRGYEQRLAGGLIDEVAIVFRDLALMKRRGPLSFGQMRLLERSKRMFVHEIAIALELDPQQVDRLVQELLEGVERNLPARSR